MLVWHKIILLSMGFMLGFLIRKGCWESSGEDQDGKRIEELSNEELKSLHKAVETEVSKRSNENPFDEFKENL